MVCQHSIVSEKCGIPRTLDSVHSTLSIRSLEISSQLADDKSQLNLVVHLNALGSQDSTLTGEHDGRGGLEEEEGLLGLGAVELSNMFPAR
jgi:hypothetical protein